MTFANQFGAAAALAALTLSLQCAGMAALIAWGRTSLATDVHRLGPFRSAVLMLQFTIALILLHVFEILLWAGFYRCSVCHYGNLPFTSQLPVMRPSAR